MAKEYQDGTGKKNIRIVIYPFEKANPYQKLLAGELEKKGYIVIRNLRKDKTLPFHLLTSCWKVKVLHLHWIAGLYEGKTPLRFVLRTLILCCSLLMLRVWRVRLILTLHNLVPHDANNYPYHIFARRLIIICIHTVIVHSFPARKMAVKRLGSREKFSVILHGNYRRYYPDNITKDEARLFLNIHNNKKVVLFFGMLKPYKGVEELLITAREFKDENILFLIAGRGESDYMRTLRENLPDNVILHDEYIPDEKIQYFMKTADCMILPYRQSLTTGAAMLGLSFRLPIVGTYAVAFEHLIEKKLCVPFDPDKPESMKKAIDEVLSWDYKDFEVRCLDFLDDCEIEKIAEEHLKVFGLL